MGEEYSKALETLRSELKVQLPEIETNGDWLWNHPETGFKEHETQKYCLDVLKNHGFEVKTWEDVTGFTCTCDTGSPGPCIMIMGELDSLICYSHPECNPETGAAHACGHSIQTATAMGAFFTLAESGVLKNFGGKIMLAGVPAEECMETEWRLQEIQKGRLHFLGGKAELLHRGAFDGVDVVISMHAGLGNDGTITILGSHNGFTAKNVIFEGRSAHAAADPENGVNALYMANTAINALNAMRETFRDSDTVQVHPIITKGGTVVNAIPEEICIECQCRAAFGMTNTEMGLCGTALGVAGIAAYLFGGIICDYVSIKKLIPFPMISTGALGLVMLTNPAPVIMIMIHGLFALTALMLFFSAQTKTVRNLAASNEQGKAFGIFEGVADIFLMRNIKEDDQSDGSDSVNFKMLTRPMRMPTVWLMIGIIFATLTLSTGYYYISPYVTEVFGVSALLGAVLSSSSQYIRPVASFGAGVLGDRINNSRVMLLGQIGLGIGLCLILFVKPSLGIVPILVACLMIFFSMYVCQTLHFAIMEEIHCPKECVGTAIGFICCLGYLPEATSPFVAGVILDKFPGETGYRLFFLFMLAVTVFGIALTLIWLRITRERRAEILANNKKPEEAVKAAASEA